MPLPQFLVTSFLIATATALPLVPDVVQKIDKAANDFPRSPAIDRAAVGLAAAAGWHLSPFASRDRVGNMQSGSPSAGPADQQSLNNRNGNLGGSVKLPTDNGQGNGYANGNNGVSSNGNGNVIVDQMRNANLEGDLSRWSIQWSDKKREWMQRCLESMKTKIDTPSDDWLRRETAYHFCKGSYNVAYILGKEPPSMQEVEAAYANRRTSSGDAAAGNRQAGLEVPKEGSTVPEEGEHETSSGGGSSSSSSSSKVDAFQAAAGADAKRKEKQMGPGPSLRRAWTGVGAAGAAGAAVGTKLLLDGGPARMLPALGSVWGGF